LARFGRKARNEICRELDPFCDRGGAAKAGWTDVDKASERSPSEIHRPDVRPSKSLAVSRRSDSDNQIVVHDTTAHVPVDGEADATKHPDLSH
jgi:hypothetical protein